MADPDVIPTFYANIVTSNLSTDDLTMEFRRIDRPHNEVMSLETPGAPLTIIPPPGPAQILALPPVARVVLTYTAAKVLKDYLDGALPRAEQARKMGTNIA
jgi:hypothetical protein